MPIFKQNKNLKINKKPKLFEKENKLLKLLNLIIVVNRGQGVAILKILLDNNVSTATSCFAEGTKDTYIMDIIGGEEKDKEIVTAVISIDKYDQIKKAIEERFNVSKAAKGIMIALEVKSIAGILAYKYISDFEGASKYVKSKK